uniref:Uncharacterized protein n=1 Tax=Cajanus cajan TaxID=3821 RepID=A0A151RHZ5_CAJCA|nr:hypothetical protein KK1_036431 [Cajanus cajan]
MSMADDDAMDFSFDTISKNKKKTFDFEKLDINFNLDGEFDKISSFKMDMSDLDFTCPPKKNSQSKDKKGDVSGAKAGKQDGFNFCFDFNELDSFNLDSSFMNVDTTSNSNPRKKGVTTEGSDEEGAKMLKTNDDEDVHASNDSMVMKSQASERLETLKVETMVAKQDGSVSKISSSGNLDMPIENQTLDMNRCESTEEVDQEKDLPQNIKLTESKSEQVINMACSQSVVINVSGDRQEVNDNATNVNSDSLDLQLEHSSPHHITMSENSVGEAINLGSNTQEGITNDSQPEKSKPLIEKMMPMKDKKLQDMQSNTLSKLEDKRSLKQTSSTVGTKCISFGNKKNADMPLGTIPQARMFHLSLNLNFRSNDIRLGSKLVGDSLTDSSKLMRDAAALLGSKDDIKRSSNTREGIVSDVTPCSGKLAGNKQSFCEVVNKSKTTFLESGMSTKDVSMLSQVESMANNLLHNHSTPGLKSPSEIKVMELEISDSVLMEDNSNVEKAEAYMKELEDVSDQNIFIIYRIVYKCDV